MIGYCMYTTKCELCGTKSSRNSRRYRKHERTSTYTAHYAIWSSDLILEDEMICIPRTARYVIRVTNWSKQQKMPKARANINVYSSARISVLIFEHEKTVWYEELNHMMFMIDLTWCDMYTTNCEICGTKSSRNRRRWRKHERTSTYTAVRHLPI